MAGRLLPTSRPKGRYGLKGGGTDTCRPENVGLTGFIVRALPFPCYTGKGKARRAVPGKTTLKIVGYYAQGKTPNWTRMKEYQVWKDHVREGAPDMPKATAARPVRVDVWCYFGSGVHPDPGNVHKGVVDALFPGGDKYVYGYHHHPLYSDAPHVLVEVSGGKL